MPDRNSGVFEYFVNTCTVWSGLKKLMPLAKLAVQRVAARHGFAQHLVKQRGSSDRHTSTVDSDLDLLVDNPVGTEMTRATRRTFCADLDAELRQDIGLVEAAVGSQAVKAFVVAADGSALHIEVMFSRTLYGADAAPEVPNPFHNHPGSQRVVRALKFLTLGRRDKGLKDLGHGYRYEALALLAAKGAPADPSGYPTFLTVLRTLVSTDTATINARALPIMRDQLGIDEVDCTALLSSGVHENWRNHSINVLRLLKGPPLANVAALERIFRGEGHRHGKV